MRHALLLCIITVVSACGASTALEAGSATVLPNLFLRSAQTSDVLDVASATKYAPAVVVGNRAEGDGAACAITGFDVTVTDLNGVTIGTFHSDAAGFVEGAHAGTPSYATVTATLLDDATMARMRSTGPQRVVIRASVTGRSVTGAAATSLPIDLPMDACSGCLPPNVGPTK